MAAIRKLVHESVPLRRQVHQALAKVGVDERYSSELSADAACEAVVLNIRAAAAALFVASEEDVGIFKTSFAQFVRGVPHRTAAYACLLACIGEDKPGCADDILTHCEAEMNKSIESKDWTGTKQFLRFFGCIANRGVIPKARLLDDLLEQLEVHMEATPFLHHRGDAVAYLVLSVLPWHPAHPTAMDKLDTYFQKRQRTQALLTRRPVVVQQYNYTQHPVIGADAEDEPDALEVLYAEVKHTEVCGAGLFPTYCDANFKSDVQVQLARLPSHAPWVAYPTQPAALCLFDVWEPGAVGTRKPVRESGEQSGVFDMLDEMTLVQRGALHLVDRAVAREVTLDLIHCFHADVKMLAECLLQVPRRRDVHIMSTSSYVVEAVLGSALSLPHSPLPLPFYTALLAQLVQAPMSPFALVLVEAFETLIEQLPLLSTSLAHRLQYLFASHLANHNFRWLWDTIREKDAQADKRTVGCRKLFWFEMTQQLMRFGTKQHLQSCIPSFVDVAKVWQDEGPLGGYKFKDADVRFKRDADGLLRKIRADESVTPEQVVGILSRVSDGEGAASDVEKAELLTQCLLLLGSDAVAHELHLLRQYTPALSEVTKDASNIITAAEEFWSAAPHRTSITVANLLQLDIVTPMDVVRWALSKSDNFERGFIWEIVFASLDVPVEKAMCAAEEAIDLEGACVALSAQNVAEDLKERTMKKLDKRIAKHNAEQGRHLTELKECVRLLFSGLVRCLKDRYKRERRELLASAHKEGVQRRAAVHNFLWSRAVLGQFNATGIRYLPFITQSLDEIYEEVLIKQKAPAVLLNIFLSWRLVRGSRAATQRGSTLMAAARHPMQEEVLRRVMSAGAAGEAETLFDRIDEGRLDPTTAALQNVSNNEPPSDDGGGDSDDGADEESEEDSMDRD